MGTFTLDDDDDAFWGEAATFGQIDTLCRQAEERQAATQPGSGLTPVPPGGGTSDKSDTPNAASPSPKRAPLELVTGLGGVSQIQRKGSALVAYEKRAVSCDVRVNPTTTTAVNGDGNAEVWFGDGNDRSNRNAPDDANARARSKHELDSMKRLLREKDAHLKMLRSRLELVERDSDTYKRVVAANAAERERERERERNAGFGGGGGAGGGHSRTTHPGFDTGGFGGNAGAGNGYGSTYDHRNQPTNHQHQSNRASGPDPMDVSNAAALAETRAELQRIKSRAAFKDEEAEEARRREDLNGVLLQRAEQETMRLAAEVRKERRRATAAEAEAASGKQSSSGKRKGGEEGVESFHAPGDGHKTNPTTALELPTPPRVPPVLLVLPSPPTTACCVTQLSSRNATTQPGPGSVVFAAVAAVASSSVLNIQRFRLKTDGKGKVVDLSGFDLAVSVAKDVLSTIACREKPGAAFVLAAARVLRVAAKTAAKKTHDHVQTGLVADTARVLCAFVKSDATCAHELLHLCGAGGTRGEGHLWNGDDSNSVWIVPKPPPDGLRGVPAAGTDCVGVLVPHPCSVGGGPDSDGTRVFVASGDEFLGLAASTAGNALPTGTGRGTGFGNRNDLAGVPPSETFTLLPDVTALLRNALSSNEWPTAFALLHLLKHLVCRASPLGGRGKFATEMMAAGVLTQTLCGSSDLSGPLGKRKEKERAHGVPSSGAAPHLTGASTHGLTGCSPHVDRKPASRHANTSSTHPERVPWFVRCEALVLIRLLAATPEFRVALDDANKETSLVEIDVGANSQALDNTAGNRVTGSVSLTRAVVQSLETACGASVFGVGANSLAENETRKQNQTKPFDASLGALSAISASGWRGWGEAVRGCGVLCAAVAAAEMAFCSSGGSIPGASLSPDFCAAEGDPQLLSHDVATTFQHSSTKSDTEKRTRSALLFVARLLAEPVSARHATSALRRDGETSRRLARVARFANNHEEQMPKRVGKYLDSVLQAWA